MDNKRIYLSPPHLDGRERELLIQSFESNWITTLGPQVDEFEKNICKQTGVPHSVALASGTSALHLALINLGIQPGDEVLCSTFTFAASASPIVYCGAKPVFIDSNISTWNLDPYLLEEELRACCKKGKIPRALIVVDLYGQSADYDPIVKLCAEYGVPIIEDAAEALGATYKGKACGSFGVMGILSFNGNKIITTSGGGMILSSNKEYINRARFLATQARDPGPHYQHSNIGFNYRLSNILAAIGIGQLENIEKKIKRRKEINTFYREALSEIDGIEFMPIASYGEPNYWLTCIIVDSSKIKVSWEDIRVALENENIESRPLWKPMHLQPIFKSCRVRGGTVSEKLFADGLCLPSGSAITMNDLNRIVDIVKKICRVK